MSDVDSSECKAGFDGDDAPRAAFPSIVGFLGWIKWPWRVATNEEYFEKYVEETIAGIVKDNIEMHERLKESSLKYRKESELRTEEIKKMAEDILLRLSKE